MNVIGKNIIRLQQVDSTNSYLLNEIQNGKYFENGTILITDYQVYGKGLDNNSWESEAGKNFLFSILLRPKYIRPDQQFLLNKAITLGISDYIKSIIGEEKISVKWPNDIYINDRKVAGVLINNTISGNEFEHSVVGIGINVNQRKFESDAPNPVSLRHFLVDDIDLKENLNILCSFLDTRYQSLINQDFDKIDKDYLSTLYRYSEVHSYKYKNQSVIARITGVSEYGKLQLIVSDGRIIECDFKEIEFDI